MERFGFIFSTIRELFANNKHSYLCLRLWKRQSYVDYPLSTLADICYDYAVSNNKIVVGVCYIFTVAHLGAFADSPLIFYLDI